MARAQSGKYQITVAKLPFARKIAAFSFDGAPIHETLVRDLAGGECLKKRRNVVLTGKTSAGKPHIAVGIARIVIREGAQGRLCTVLDLINQRQAETCTGRAGHLAEHMMRFNVFVLDELGYLPFAQSGPLSMLAGNFCSG